MTSLPNPSDRRVTVTGSGEAQWKAQCLLFRKVFLEALSHLDLNPDVANDPQIRQGQLRVEINVPSSQVRIRKISRFHGCEAASLFDMPTDFPSHGSFFKSITFSFDVRGGPSLCLGDSDDIERE